MRFAASVTMLKKEAETIRGYIANNARDKAGIEQRLSETVKLEERYQRELDQYLEAIKTLEKGDEIIEQE